MVRICKITQCPVLLLLPDSQIVRMKVNEHVCLATLSIGAGQSITFDCGNLGLLSRIMVTDLHGVGAQMAQVQNTKGLPDLPGIESCGFVDPPAPGNHMRNTLITNQMASPTQQWQ